MQRSSILLRLLAAAVLVAQSAVPARAAEPALPAPPAKPQRIVSLDGCVDQLLLDLVERGRIAAVTHLASDASVSAIPDKARSIAFTRGSAEDVLRFDPDLVLAGPYGVPATVDLLRRLGKRVVIVPQPQDLEGVRDAVRIVAEATGNVAEGEAMIARFDQHIVTQPVGGHGLTK